MRLTARFLLALVATMALALGINAWLNVERERDLFDRGLRSDSLLVGELVAQAHDVAVRVGDIRGAADVMVSANQVHTGFTFELVDAAATPAAVRDTLTHGFPAATRDETARPDGRLDTYVPLRAGAANQAVHVTAHLAEERQYVRDTKRRAVISSVAALVLASAAMSALGIVLIARPTRALIDKTRRVGRGDFAGPLRLRQHDELGDLAGAVNAMSDNLRAAVEQLRHADRLSTVGRLSAGIAHELGTPLNVIDGRAKMIQSGEAEGAEVTDSARIIVEQARRITGIVRQLLDFGRRGERSRRPVDVIAVASQAERLLAATARAASVTLTGPATREPLIVPGDEAQLLQVVTNLVVNAIHATPPHGRVTIDARAADRHVVVEVGDTGSGMDAATRERIFEPFFTTKEVGKGTGLGLSVVHGIVDEHGGRVEVESTPGAGTRFSVHLPVS